jgi:hypothetical protein
MYRRMLVSSDPFLRVTHETISLPSRHNSTESGPESERAFQEVRPTPDFRHTADVDPPTSAPQPRTVSTNSA